MAKKPTWKYVCGNDYLTNNPSRADAIKGLVGAAYLFHRRGQLFRNDELIAAITFNGENWTVECKSAAMRKLFSQALKSSTDRGATVTLVHIIDNARPCKVCGAKAGQECRDHNLNEMGSAVHAYGGRFEVN